MQWKKCVDQAMTSFINPDNSQYDLYFVYFKTYFIKQMATLDIIGKNGIATTGKNYNGRIVGLTIYLIPVDSCLPRINLIFLFFFSVTIRSSSQWTVWAQISPLRRGWRVFLSWSRLTLIATITAVTSPCTEPTARSRFSVIRWTFHVSTYMCTLYQNQVSLEPVY